MENRRGIGREPDRKWEENRQGSLREMRREKIKEERK
jgi:hypothetical protein